MTSSLAAEHRWELYKVLSEPLRLRLLSLSAHEELSIGELAELVGEHQPNVSRHLSPLRSGGLLDERRQGTRVLLRLSEAVRSDPVVVDALEAGRRLCARDGSLRRVASIVAQRDADAREFFGREGDLSEGLSFPAELPAYLAALSPLLPRRRLAIDAGTGDGRLLEVLAPLFEQVVAVDREAAQLSRAAQRVRLRGYDNVMLVAADLQAQEAPDTVLAYGPADVVFASRVLHHAPRPAQTVAHLSRLLAPGGHLLVLDYAPHHDEAMRGQADLWLGFAEDELLGFARAAGLSEAHVTSIAPAFCGGGPDGHLNWQLLMARRCADGAVVMQMNTEKRHGREIQSR